MRDLAELVAGWIYALRITSGPQWVLRVGVLACGMGAAALGWLWFPMILSTALLVAGSVLALAATVRPDSGAALGLVAVVYLFARRRIPTPFTKDSVRNSMFSGGLFGFANAFILLALATGALALVGLLTAMYPLATVLLARFALKEHISRWQWVGIIGAVTAAALMSIG